ncbi:MAG: hypothetical protein O3A63_15800 [Proteobacteria bacterium]|nr:hypothetical protein [Pseudomonadota bacterium]
MPAMKHPMSGAIYTLRDDGLVDVDNNGLKGVFRFDGRYHSGDLRHADPHMLLWLAGPQLPADADTRKHKG